MLPGIPVFDSTFKRHLEVAFGAHVDVRRQQEKVGRQSIAVVYVWPAKVESVVSTAFKPSGFTSSSISCMASFASCNSKSWSSESPTMVSNLVRISGAFMKVGR